MLYILTDAHSLFYLRFIERYKNDGFNKCTTYGIKTIRIVLA